LGTIFQKHRRWGSKHRAAALTYAVISETGLLLEDQGKILPDYSRAHSSTVLG
jgi:hypothetical protein